VNEPVPSYWFSRSASREEADLVVVGAGIVGVSTAWWATRVGRRVLLLEAQRVAAGSSGRNIGFLVTGGLVPFVRVAASVGEERALRLWEMSQESLGLLRRELLNHGQVECGWRPEGSWRTAPAGSAAEAEWEQSAERLAREGFAVDWRERDAVCRASGSSIFGGALHVEGDGGVDPVALCRGMLARSGADLRAGVAVRGIEPAAGDRVRVVWAGGEVLARNVVLAVNAHSGPLLPAVGARLRPVSVQGLATAPVSAPLSGLWVVSPQGFLLRQLADGTRLAALGVGAASGSQEGGFLELPTAEGQARLESTLHELFPRDGTVAVQQRWAGTIAMTADGLPWMRSVEGIPGAAYACGFNGGGLSLGFALGRRLARWATDGQEAHLKFFAPAAAGVAV
jgi:gamma-glutamylputrescine oxidase